MKFLSDPVKSPEDSICRHKGIVRAVDEHKKLKTRKKGVVCLVNGLYRVV